MKRFFWTRSLALLLVLVLTLTLTPAALAADPTGRIRRRLSGRRIQISWQTRISRWILLRLLLLLRTRSRRSDSIRRA